MKAVSQILGGALGSIVGVSLGWLARDWFGALKERNRLRAVVGPEKKS